MPNAKVMIDSVGYKPDPEGKSLEERKYTLFAGIGEEVELPDSEYERLSKIGAVAEAGSDDAKQTRTQAVTRLGMGPHGTTVVGPPLPGQTADQIRELVEQRVGEEKPEQPNRDEMYPYTVSAETRPDPSEGDSTDTTDTSEGDLSPRASRGRRAAAEASSPPE